MANYNASSSIFGWHFQINVAIVYFIKNIQKINNVRVEGASEDVELTLSNNNKIYIQTKSYRKLDENMNALKNLTGGIKTLINDSKNRDAEEVDFITNYKNPLGGTPDEYNAFNGGYFIERPYKELKNSNLSKVLDKKIKKAEKDYGAKFPTGKFNVVVMPYDGTSDKVEVRERYTRSQVDKFISRLELNSNYTEDILDIWKSDMFFNASQKTTVSLAKSELIWPLIVLKCELKMEDRLFDEYEDILEIDSEEAETIVRKYRKVIDKKTEQFEFINRVIGDYKDYRSDLKRKKDAIKKFVQNCWKNYSNDIKSDSMRPELQEYLIKIILLKVTKNNGVISSISKEVEL